MGHILICGRLSDMYKYIVMKENLTKNDNNILVAIKCLAYNHEPYIRECLEGFVMQQTNFKFVAIVHDDASTDRTADIIREYETKYPDIIKPIYETKNQYSKHDGSLGRIMDAAVDATGAKYIAMCEGDDYWTDPLKLQKQVDFLEKHEEYSMCFHAAEIKNETKDIEIITCKDIENKDYLTNDIFPGWTVPTASVVYRKDLVGSFPKIKHSEWMKYGDIVLFLKCTHQGKVRGMSEVMSVYRMTESGAVVSQKKEKDCMEKLCLHYRMLMLNFPQLDRKWPKEFIGTYRYSQFKNTSSLIKKVKFLSSTIYYYPALVMGKMLHLLLPSKW